MNFITALQLTIIANASSINYWNLNHLNLIINFNCFNSNFDFHYLLIYFLLLIVVTIIVMIVIKLYC